MQTCDWCQKQFAPRSHHVQTYCSRSCAAKARPPRKGNSGSFSKGVKAWNKGMAGYMAGRKVPEITRQKISAAQRGHRAPNWRGGVSPEHERIRKSARYKVWRESVFSRDNFTCQLCGDRSAAGHRVRVHADHIKPFATFPELRFDLANGRTLCEPCHRSTPTWGFTGQKGERIGR